MAKFLDDIGLGALWAKSKELLAAAGDMQTSVYDPQGRGEDVFAAIDAAEAAAKAASRPVDWLPEAVEVGGIPCVSARTAEGGLAGVNYAVTIPGMDTTPASMLILMRPVPTSNSTEPTLSINGGPEKRLRRRVSSSPVSTAAGEMKGWLNANNWYLVQVNGTSCTVIDRTKPSATDLSGIVPLEHGGLGVGSATAGSYLIGNGTEPVQTKTPAEVLVDIGADSSKSITLPAGRMAGDINGDGIVDDADIDSMTNGTGSAGIQYFNTAFSSEFPDGQVPIDYRAADINGDGGIDNIDLSLMLKGTYEPYGAFPGKADLLGAWTARADAPTDGTATWLYQVDIPVSGLKATDAAVVVIASAGDAVAAKAKLCHEAECHDGFLRVRTLRCPIAALEAVVTVYQDGGRQGQAMVQYAGLCLGERADTAYRGDRGKAAYDHSQQIGNPHQTTPEQLGAAPADHSHDEMGAKGINWKDAADLPSSYPQGMTIFFSDRPENKFNAQSYCTVVTIKGHNNMVCVQYLYPYLSDSPITYRYALYNTDAWREWRRLSVDGHTHTAGQVGAASKEDIITIRNISVPASAWTADATYSAQGYGSRAAVARAGVTAAHRPDVAFGAADAVSGNFAPVADSYAGGVYIYCKTKPTATVTIPSIVCIKGV